MKYLTYYFIPKFRTTELHLLSGEGLLQFSDYVISSGNIIKNRFMDMDRGGDGKIGELNLYFWIGLLEKNYMIIVKPISPINFQPRKA